MLITRQGGFGLSMCIYKPAAVVPNPVWPSRSGLQDGESSAVLMTSDAPREHLSNQQWNEAKGAEHATRETGQITPQEEVSPIPRCRALGIVWMVPLPQGY